MKQTLYVDFSGGQFVTWFYSEGTRYRGICTAFYYDELMPWKRKQGFTDMVITGEARLFIS
jgi:hypothetical protein